MVPPFSLRDFFLLTPQSLLLLYLFQTMKMPLDMRLIQALFSLKITMPDKARDPTPVTDGAFGPGMNVWFGRFRWGYWSLWDKERAIRLTTCTLDQTSCLLLFKLHKKLPKNLTSTFPQSFGF